mmetsp:Transcript_625/g.1285  ORF Transcript_625/g.1285 Transcript_625/m.1285 type:complete len:95 (+) Transcript_625:1955-2239(+)
MASESLLGLWRIRERLQKRKMSGASLQVRQGRQLRHGKIQFNERQKLAPSNARRYFTMWSYMPTRRLLLSIQHSTIKFSNHDYGNPFNVVMSHY